MTEGKEMHKTSPSEIYQYIEECLEDWDNEDYLDGRDEEFFVEEAKSQLQKIEEMLGFGEERPLSDRRLR